MNQITQIYYVYCNGVALEMKIFSKMLTCFRDFIESVERSQPLKCVESVTTTNDNNKKGMIASHHRYGKHRYFATSPTLLTSLTFR